MLGNGNKRGRCTIPYENNKPCSMLNPAFVEEFSMEGTTLVSKLEFSSKIKSFLNIF